MSSFLLSFTSFLTRYIKRSSHFFTIFTNTKVRQNTPHFDAFSTLFSVFGIVVRHALTWLPYYFKLDKISSKKSELRKRFSIQASQSESPQKWPWKVELKGNKKIDPSSQLKLWPNLIYRLFTPKSQHIFIFSFAIPCPSDLTSKWGIARNLTGNWTPTPEWDAIPSLVPPPPPQHLSGCLEKFPCTWLQICSFAFTDWYN